MTCACASAEELAVCLDHNIVRVDGVNHRVAPQGAELAFALVRSMGLWVTPDAIERALWGSRAPAGAPLCVNTIATALRKAIATTRLRIEGKRNRGLRAFFITSIAPRGSP